MTEASGLHAACLCSVFPRHNPALEAGFGRVICAQKGCSIRVEQGLPASTAGTVCFTLLPGPNHDHCGISTNTGFKPASINVGRIGVGVLERAFRILPMNGCAVREGKGCDCPGGKSLKLSGLRLTPWCCLIISKYCLYSPGRNSSTFSKPFPFRRIEGSDPQKAYSIRRLRLLSTHNNIFSYIFDVFSHDQGLSWFFTRYLRHFDRGSQRIISFSRQWCVSL